MKTVTLFAPKIGRGIVHLFFLSIACIFFVRSSNDFLNSRSLEIYNSLMLIFLFYIHSLVLVPMLLEKKNFAKYLFLSLGCFVVIVLCHSWFHAVHSSLITYHVDGTRPVPMDFFFQKTWIIGGFIELFPLFIVFGFLSFVYYLLIHDIKSFSPYLEVCVNVIVVLLIIVVALEAFTSKFSLLTFLGIALFYCNAFYVTPLLVEDKKKLKYCILLVALCIAYYILVINMFAYMAFDPETGANVADGNKIYLILLASGILFMALLLSFVYSYVRIKIKIKENSLGRKLGAKVSELNLLKSQVNPHFLFNSLNTLYATALTENATKTGESIAKLASLIRYMQEDINKNFIPLETEIKYLRDYIAIQKLRCAIEPQVEVHFVNFENHFISPGLLIPFVENAFKYGIDPSKPSKLEVSVYCNEDEIIFKCVNSYDEDYKTYYKEQGFGIGIENARQRLELVYAKKYTLEIRKENDVFSVKIVINTLDK